jgi:hypothetical protein
VCKLLDTEDVIDRARHLVDAIFMAAEGLPRREGDAIQAVAGVASGELKLAAIMLQEYRAEQPQPAPPNPA